jgi:hypothetical protein
MMALDKNISGTKENKKEKKGAIRIWCTEYVFLNG